MKKKIRVLAIGGTTAILLILGFMVFVFGHQFFQKKSFQNQKILPTYFSYSQEELNSLKKLKSKFTIQTKDLWRWDDRAFETVGGNKIDATIASKFYAYLTVAQRDAAYLSWNTHGQFLGSIDFISKEITCFFSSSCDKIFLPHEDAYSKALAEIVLANVRQRMEEDSRSTHPYPLESGEKFWAGKAPFKGIETGSWKTWLIPSVQEFRLPPPRDPHSPEVLKQLEQIKSVFPTLTDEKKKAIAFWAGGPGTKTPPGLWLKNADTIMKKTGTDLAKALFIRSVLAMGIADTEIAAMDSKYTYWVKRPFMVDNSILTFMPTPNHPSYPSDSTAIAGFSGAFLTGYFPDEKEKWNSLVTEAANSRVESGIHFLGDVEQGLALGRNIAATVLRQVEQNSAEENPG